MSENSFNPYRQVNILRQALSSDKNRVAFLIGAGCPVSVRIKRDGEDNDSPLIDDIAGLTKKVCESLKDSNINKIVSRIALPKDKSATITEAMAFAKKTTNLSLISKNAVFCGGESRPWKIKCNESGNKYDYCIEVDETEGPENSSALCNIGNFKIFGQFLLKQTGSEYVEVKSAE
jgi:hypothetical protein